MSRVHDKPGAIVCIAPTPLDSSSVARSTNRARVVGPVRVRDPGADDLLPMRSSGFRLGLLLATSLALASPASAIWWLKRDRDTPQSATLDQLDARLWPYRTDRVTLSPDGRHLAYSVIEGSSCSVDVVAVDDPSSLRHYNFGDTHGGRLLALLWTSPERLVVSLENGVIAVLDLPDAGIRKLVDPGLFAYEHVELPDATSLPGAASSESQPIEIVTQSMHRWPQLLGVSPDEPDVIFVQGVAGTSLQDAIVETARIDVRTGRLTYLDHERVRESGTRVWSDRQGRLRLIEMRDSFPLTWRVRPDPAARWRAWKSLDDVVAKEVAAGFAVTADRMLDARSFPLGFGRDNTVLYFASNVGRATIGIYALDMSTGRRTDFALEDPHLDLARPLVDAIEGGMGRFDRNHREMNAAAHYIDATAKPRETPLVFDRASGDLVGVRIDAAGRQDRWLDEALADVQTELGQWFPERHVRIVDWDDARARFALRVTGGADAGRYFVYLRDERRCVEFLRRDPRTAPEQRHQQERFTYTDRQGRARPARLTLPRVPVVDPPPIVVLLPDAPWLKPGALREQVGPALAELGCIVLELDHPFAHAAHRTNDPVTRRAPAEQAVEDITSAMEHVVQRHGGSRKRISIVGIGYGGWLALRVAQLQPEQVRVVVALNAFDTLETLTRRLPERRLPGGESRALSEAKEVINYLEAIRADFGSAFNNAANAAAGGAEGEEGGGGGAATQDLPLGTSRLAFQRRMMVPKEREGVNLPGELARRYFADALADDGEPAVSDGAEQMRCAVYLIHDADNPYAPPGNVGRLRRRLAAAGRPVEYWEAPTADWHRPLEERPEVWRQAGLFLLDALYRYDVEIGPTREVRP